jgi:hypothetical protein
VKQTPWSGAHLCDYCPLRHRSCHRKTLEIRTVANSKDCDDFINKSHASKQLRKVDILWLSDIHFLSRYYFQRDQKPVSGDPRGNLQQSLSLVPSPTEVISGVIDVGVSSRFQKAGSSIFKASFPPNPSPKFARWSYEYWIGSNHASRI